MSNNQDEGTEEFEISDDATGHLTIDDELDDPTDPNAHNIAEKTNNIVLENVKIEEESLEEIEEGAISQFFKNQIPTLYNLFFKLKNAKKMKSAKSEDEAFNDDEEERVESSQPKSLLSKLFSRKGSPSSKKKGLTPIHIIVLLLLGIFMFYDENETINTDTKIVEVKKNKPKPVENEVKSIPKVDSKENEEPKVAIDSPSEQTNFKFSQEVIPEVEEKKELKETIESQKDKVEVSERDKIQDAFKEENLDLPVLEEPIVENEETITNDGVPSSDLVESEVKKVPEEIIESPIVSEKIIEVDADDIVDINLSGSGSDISTQILEGLEKNIEEKGKRKIKRKVTSPVEAPDYDIPGRGLVYNCSDQHWACVGQTGHDICEQNFAWNSSKGLKIECYPFELFEAPEICEFNQQSKINKVTDTKFCENN